MYQARDVTGTVGCQGLITSSIISKKVERDFYVHAKCVLYKAGPSAANACHGHLCS